MADISYFDSRPKVFEEIAGQVSYCIIDVQAVQFIACEQIVRFVRENCQMTYKKLYCADMLQMLFTDSDSEGEYLRFGNDDRPSNDRTSPCTSLLCNGAAGHGKSVHKAQTSDHFGPLPNGDGGGRGGRGLRVHRGSALLMITPDCVFFSDRAHSKSPRQTVQVQSVLGNVRSVRCAMQ